MATEIDIEQSTQIAALEKDVELLREEVDKYKDKEHEQFNNRISKLEKWVWGCSAVIACVVTVGGIIPKFVTVGDNTSENNRKFLDEVVIPSLKKAGWESQFFKMWDKKGAWEQYNK